LTASLEAAVVAVALIMDKLLEMAELVAVEMVKHILEQVLRLEQ